MYGIYVICAYVLYTKCSTVCILVSLARDLNPYKIYGANKLKIYFYAT